jgi:hypothetical protein
MKFSRFLLTAAVLLLPAAGLQAELIPASRLTTWTPGVTVGVLGGIPTNRTTIYTTLAASPSNDQTSAINTAISSCPSGQVVMLAAGTHRCDGVINVGSNKTLRGAGMDVTIIDSHATGQNAVWVGSNTDWNFPGTFVPITAGLTKGSTSLTVANGASFSAGQMIRFLLADDLTLPVVKLNSSGTSGTGSQRGQMTMVTGKAGNVLSIFPGVYGNWSGVAWANVQPLSSYSTGVGIEDLTIDCTNGTPGFAIMFEQVYGSWIKNVHTAYPSGYSIYFWQCVNCELRHSYLDSTLHAGSNGAGLLVEDSSACLIEDNIIYKNFPLIEVNFNTCGNVFAYNFCEDSSVYGVQGAGLDTNHGPHNSYNLYEGNIVDNVECDGYFGGASEDTLFRNWFTSVCPGVGIRSPVLLKRFTRNYNLVGNLLGTTGQNIATYNMGGARMGDDGYGTGTASLINNSLWADWASYLAGTYSKGANDGFQERDLDVAATTILKGNWNSQTGGVPSNESLGSDTLPNSLYLSGKPAWFGNLAWPAFDPSNPNQSPEAIPAGYRYVHGIDPPGGPIQAPSNATTAITTY